MQNAIGRTRTQTDLLDLNRAVAMHAAMGLAGDPPGTGEALPPFWHYLYFWEPRPPGQLGRDGHPKTGDFLPDCGLPRRMWAGGQLDFWADLRIGEVTEKTSTISDIARKSGRTGDLALVTIEHSLSQNGQVCLREKQNLIYREDPAPGAPPPVPPVAAVDETLRRDASFDPTLLFRYSALTFNGHRIHYDQTYTREVEGYPDLVTHGPLLAQLLIDMARAELGHLRTFRFRATAPLFVSEIATCCAKPTDQGLALWVRAPDGRQCMNAEAS